MKENKPLSILSSLPLLLPSADNSQEGLLLSVGTVLGLLLIGWIITALTKPKEYKQYYPPRSLRPKQ